MDVDSGTEQESGKRPMKNGETAALRLLST